MQITPIRQEHLAAIGAFLHANLNPRFSAERWISSLVHPWASAPPNHGMQLHDGDQLVGVFCAIYADLNINGRTEPFCNPHSWCVLDAYRRHGIGLVLQLIKQPGYHFTMFTPNPKVTEVFRGLKFKDLDVRQRVAINLPTLSGWRPGAFAESRLDHIAARLSGPSLVDFEAHRRIPWLRFVAFGVHADACLAIYKPVHWKRLPGAWLMHLSDVGAFERHQGLLRSHLLLQHRLAITRVEQRWLSRPPWLSVASVRTQPKLYLSKTLTPGQIPDAYSELMALDV